MRQTVCIDCFAGLTAEGLLSPAGVVPWESDQAGPEDLRRPQVLDRLHPSFGKLMLPDKLAFGVTALMLSRYRGVLDESTGVCISLPYGSFSTDLRFNETVRAGAPSPAVFSATLPSSPVSEVTIFCKFRGPNRVFAGGTNPSVDAFESAWRAVVLGKADAMVALSVVAIERQDRSSPLIPQPTQPVRTNEAHAILFRRSPGADLRITCDFGWETGGGTPVMPDGADYFRAVIDMLRQTRRGDAAAAAGGSVATATFAWD